MPKPKATPAELKEGLKPIKISVLLSRQDYARACALALKQRETELSRKLEALRKWYGVAAGPTAYRELCIALAAERFPGFREKSGRKPKKWTMAALWILAGEMCRELESGGNQEQAAKRLAKREPWRSLLASGGWRAARASGRREAWETLLHRYTHTPARHRSIGEHAYSFHAATGTVDDWDRELNEMLQPGS